MYACSLAPSAWCMISGQRPSTQPPCQYIRLLLLLESLKQNCGRVRAHQAPWYSTHKAMIVDEVTMRS